MILQIHLITKKNQILAFGLSIPASKFVDINLFRHRGAIDLVLDFLIKLITQKN